MVGCSSLRLSSDQVPQREVRQASRVALEERSGFGGRVPHGRIHSDFLTVHAALNLGRHLFLVGYKRALFNVILELMSASEKTFPEAKHAEEIKVEPSGVSGGGLEPEAEQKKPLKPGEIFDPEVEIKRVLKFSGEEREKKFAEYKEKFRCQKEGLAEMEEALRDFIGDNPDASMEEILSKANVFFGDYGLTVEQRLKSFSAISKYIEKRADINSALQRFMKDGKEPPIDSELFFEALFGSRPEGKVDVIVGSVSIFLRCHNKLDYVCGVKVAGLLSEGVDAGTIIEMSLGSEAIKLNRTLVSGLDNAVTLENTEWEEQRIRARGLSAEESASLAETESRNNFLHEEQHAVYSLLKEEEAGRSERHADILSAENEEDRFVAARLYFKGFLPVIFSRDKDEILARMSGEFSEGEFVEGMEDLRPQFRDGGFYDLRATYGENILRRVLERLEQEARAAVIKAKDEIFGANYDKKIDSAFDAVYTLVKAGYGLKRSRAMLRSVPLSKWQREVARLIGGTA